MARLHLIHAGFRKAASSSLQHHFFGAHPGINNLGKYYGGPDKEAAWDLVNYLMLTGQAAYDQGLAQAKYQAAVGGRLSAGLANVFSDERLTVSGGLDAGLVAERLARLAGEPDILLVLRRPLDVVVAQWVHLYTQRKLAIALDDWIQVNFEFQHSYLTAANYGPIVAAYARYFGRGRVHVFLYEAMVQDMAGFVAKVCDLLGIDRQVALPLLDRSVQRVAERPSARQVAVAGSPLLRRAAGLARGALPPAAVAGLRQVVRGGGRAAPRPAPALAARIAELCRAGNRQLAAEYGLPLERFGYPL
ncbi:MAG: sulfotransferase domain-containing protein [Alphaproteobacteria bacterium]|nr:sulfotransferase domain-containing protein [Alphaproteobacteria bacterium]